MSTQSEQQTGCLVWLLIILAVATYYGLRNRHSEQQPESPRQPPPAPRVDLRQAVEQGTVEASVTGDDLTSVSITLRSKASEPITVVVPAGIVFRPPSGNLQSMMVVSDHQIRLDPSEQTTRSVTVACINMHRGVPGESHSLTITTGPSGDLSKLLQIEDFRKAPFRIRQFAVWTITDNPSRTGYTGIGMFGFGSGPDDEEMTAIRSLFLAAAINPGNYRAFGAVDQPRAQQRATETAKKPAAVEAPLRAAEHGRIAAARAEEERRRKDQEQRRFEVLDTTQSGSRTIIKIRLLSKTADQLTADQLSDLAMKVSDQGNSVVWFYLPDMTDTERAWAVSTRRGKQLPQAKFFKVR